MKVSSVWLCVLAFCAWSAACGQTVSPQTPSSPTPSPNVQRDIERMVNSYRAWGPVTDTANMSLALQIVRQTKDGIEIGMATSRLPQDKTYSLMMWPISQHDPGVIAEGITLNAAGAPVCTGKDGACSSAPGKQDTPLTLTLPLPAPGEPVRIALVSRDSEAKVFAKIVPVPLRGSDKSCTLDAIILAPGAELIWFEANGFAPNTALTVTSLSAREPRIDTKHANPDGTYQMADLPFVDGKKNGDVTLSIRSAECNPSVTVPWGYLRSRRR